MHRIALAALFVLMAVRIGATWLVFNDTTDEQAHIVAGVEILQDRRYDFEAAHPPLARLVLAAVPYFRAGLRHEAYWLWSGGAWSNHPESYYWYTLALARSANLLFAALALGVVWLWASRLHGPGGGLLACLVAACCPNVLAHAGLATLDMAAAATLLAAAYALGRWSENPGSLRWSLTSAVTCAAAVLSKFSALAFLPPIALSYFVLARRRPRRLAWFLICAPLVVWAGYAFQFGRLTPAGHHYIGPVPLGPETGVTAQFARLIEHAPLPAPKFWKGIIDLAAHNQFGHPAYLLGRVSHQGFWYYFPVALAVKTTLPLLLLAGFAVWRGDRSRLAPPLLGAAVVLAVSMAGNINIGIRHVLAVYLFLAIVVSGLAAAALSRRAAVAVAALVAWHAGESALAHPDYLAYFNQFARGREHLVLGDSNLDWGQDLARLARYLRENGIEEVQLLQTGPAHASKFRLHGRPLTGEPGWIAVSTSHLYGTDPPSPLLDRLRAMRPRARVGTFWLYFVPVTQSSRNP